MKMTQQEKIDYVTGSAKEKITAAMKTLGVKGKVEIQNISINRYKVILNNEYFGIFDTIRNTFVD